MKDLSPRMQERLQKWREKTSLAASAEKKERSPSALSSHPGDYGDNIRDFELKEKAWWDKERENNSRYTRR